MKNDRRARSIKRQQKKRARRQILVLVSFLLMLVGLFARITFLNIVYGDEYEREVIRQQVTHRGVDVMVNPNRGNIVDRNGQNLAFSTTVYNIVLDVRRMFEAGDTHKERVVDVLHEILDIPRNRMWEYLATNQETGRPVRDTHYLVIERQVPMDVAANLRAQNLRHVILEEDTKRHYPQGDIAAPLIGFLRGDNSHWGIERAYNSMLEGIPGRNVRMFNEQGFAQTTMFRPQSGHTVVTTIDANLQQFTTQTAQYYGELTNAQSAVVIIMNPNTGELMAMSQYPTFDSSDPFNIELVNCHTTRQMLYEQTEEERLNSFFGLWSNFNITDSFEVGSVFKTIVASAALEEGLVRRDEVFFCRGYIELFGHRIHCIARSGYRTLSEAMAISCNTTFMELGRRLGRDRLYEYKRDFGIGSTTGIDLHGEADVRNLTYSLHQLNPVEIATSSIGQGFNMTPIQLITAFSAVINGGNIVRPFVVSRVMDQADNTVVMENTPIIKRNVISQSTSDFWRNEMVHVFSPTGTGRNANVEGFAIGGKTGTGEQGVRGSGEYALSFVAYLPADDPQYIVLVSLNRPEEGTSVVPMFSTVIEHIILHRGIRPYDDSNMYSSAIVTVEDYVGGMVIDVTRHLTQKGLTFELHGSGSRVINQVPLEGSSVAIGSRILLYLSDDETEELTPVPNLVDMPLEGALEVLRMLELNYTLHVLDMYNELNLEEDEDFVIRDENAQQVIVGQMPSAGIRVPKETEITLLVNFLSIED